MVLTSETRIFLFKPNRHDTQSSLITDLQPHHESGIFDEDFNSSMETPKLNGL